MDMYDNNSSRKFNAEIMIRPNSEAEMRQMEELERQTRENDALIQEMRSLNARNIEVMNRVESLLGNIALPSGEDEEKALILAKLDQVMNLIREKPEGGNEAVMARLEELSGMVSPLLLSDVGCAAALCHAALQSAAMNVWVNTRTLKGDQDAEALNKQVRAILEEALPKTEAVARTVAEKLQS